MGEAGAWNQLVAHKHCPCPCCRRLQQRDVIGGCATAAALACMRAWAGWRRAVRVPRARSQRQQIAFPDCTAAHLYPHLTCTQLSP